MCLSAFPTLAHKPNAMTSETALRAAAVSALDLDALRASLRASLAARLLGSSDRSHHATPPTCPFARAADALVADHLAATGRHHTLAVFRAEAGWMQPPPRPLQQPRWPL